MEEGDIEPITEWPVTSNEVNSDDQPVTKKLQPGCKLGHQSISENHEPIKARNDEPITDKNDKPIRDEHFLSFGGAGSMWHLDSYKEEQVHELKRRILDKSKQPADKRQKMSSTARRTEGMARTALARWWRQEGQHLTLTSDLPKTTNPNTLLHHIARSKPGKSFLQSEEKRLQTLLDSGHCEADVYAALGSVQECLGQLSLARESMQCAIDIQPEIREYRWQLHKIRRQYEVHLQQEKLLQKTFGQSGQLPPFKQVKRVSANDLSVKEFFYKYSLTSTPVILTDLVDRMTSTPWTLQHIAQVAGDVKVTLKKPVSQSVEWAGLEQGETTTVGEYIRQVLGKDQSASLLCDQYLFDWSLPLHCPQLMQELSIPRYFAGDLLQRTSPSSLYQDSWPSLFIAQAGLCSQLHVDAFASNFWMALFQGKKRWTFFSSRDVPCLYPHYVHSMDPVFDVDLKSQDQSCFPLLTLAQPLQCDLQEGEVLFVPSGCPHHVENLEDSVAISANFVDLSNFEAVKQELSVNALLDPRAADLFAQLEDPEFPVNMDSPINELPWKQFKSRKLDN